MSEHSKHAFVPLNSKSSVMCRVSGCWASKYDPIHTQAEPKPVEIKVPRWKWMADEEGDFYMERWSKGDWVKHSDHEKAFSQAQQRIRELEAQAPELDHFTWDLNDWPKMPDVEHDGDIVKAYKMLLSRSQERIKELEAELAKHRP